MEDNFYSLSTRKWAGLIPALSAQIALITSKVWHVFVPKFCHEKRARNVLKHLVYVGEHTPDNTQCKYKEIDRKYYEYKKSIDVSSKSILATNSDWPFPKTY